MIPKDTNVPIADEDPCQARRKGRVWPETGGQGPSAVRKVEQKRSPWTWDPAWDPRFGDTGRVEPPAGFRTLALA